VSTAGRLVASFLAVTMWKSPAFAATGQTIQVKGTGYDQLNGAVVHSKQKTATGLIQRSTEIVVLNGDLHGRVLYQVTSVIDDKADTLVNSGNQVFSGTVAGSAPVMLYDSKFRFYVNLKTGEEHGSVYLTDHLAGPRVQCELQIVGTGKRSDGNPTFKYTGTCTFASKDAA
jgi:hypothetical protein